MSDDGVAIATSHRRKIEPSKFIYQVYGESLTPSAKEKSMKEDEEASFRNRFHRKEIGFGANQSLAPTTVTANPLEADGGSVCPTKPHCDVGDNRASELARCATIPDRVVPVVGGSLSRLRFEMCRMLADASSSPAELEDKVEAHEHERSGEPKAPLALRS